MITISKIWIWFSFIILSLVTTASLLGILNPLTYSRETANWSLQAVGQDFGNLLAVLVFLISTIFLTKKSLKFFPVWLGGLLYFIYAYLIYSFFIHFNYLFFAYVAVLGLSTYTLIGSLWSNNKTQLIKSLDGKRMNSAGIILVVTGVLFGLLWLSEIISALSSGQIPRSAQLAGVWVNPVQVIDLSLVLPGMILTGILVLRKKPLGYLFTAPWLTFSVLMGSSIVFTLIMEISKGNSEAIVPLIMVSIIVVASAIALYSYLRKIQIKQD